MKVLYACNVDHALAQGLRTLSHPEYARVRRSRNGEVVVYDTPVTTVYLWPKHRVSFWAPRDANPFFHLYEAMWMLGGRNDVASVAAYVERMRTYSDDGETLHGAYGHRWRRHFGFDQLVKIAHRLREDADDRRCVLQMWDASEDLDVPSKDLPCNTQVYFTRDHQGHLDMTVMCRSNDIIWGAYGANVVHFSMLLEYMAAAIGCPVGIYRHLSNNYHAYTPLYTNLLTALTQVPVVEYYYGVERGHHRVDVHPLISTPVPSWDLALRDFLDGVPSAHNDPFFPYVAQPMHDAYRFYKDGKIERAIERLGSNSTVDWLVAGQGWLMRRLMRRLDNLDRSRGDSPAEET